MVRIPSEYQEVEYLESTGTQYIDLPFGFLDTDEVEIVGSINTGQPSDKYMVCSIVWNNNNNRFAMLGQYYGNFTFGLGAMNTVARLSPRYTNDGKIYKWTYDNRIFNVYDGDSVLTSGDSSSATFSEETKALRLFYGYSGTTKGKIAYYHHKKANGTEVNLIPCYRKSDNEPGMYDTVSKQFYTNSGTGAFLKGNDVTYDNINLLESRRMILLNTPHIETVSDTIASFKTDVATKLKGCKIHFTPIQEGEGDPSPENVRPIHGWDGVEVTACGKNLCPLINDTNYWSKKAWFDSDGVTHSSTSYVMCDYKKIPKNGTYFLSSIGRSWKGIGFYDESYNPLKFNQKTMKTISLTTVEGAVYYRVYAKTDAPSANIQFELGSTATTYEPYTVTTLTIPFPQTIYGGYVDLVKGEVVEEFAKVTLDGSFSPGIFPWQSETSEKDTGEILVKALYLKRDTNDNKHYRNVYLTAKCDKLVCTSNYNIVKRGCSFYDGNSYSICLTLPKNLIGTTKEELNKYLNDNPINTVFELQTPITYTIDPQTLKALRGRNNIWSDANGNIEVSYYTH